MLACEAGNLQKVRVILQKQANPKKFIESMHSIRLGGCKNTPLHAGAVSGCAALCELLVQYKCQINARAYSDDNSTPLMLAALHGHTEAGQVLVHLGANVHATNAQGDTALSLAVGRGNFAFCTFLVDSGGASLQHANILPSAAQSGNVDLCRWIMEEQNIHEPALLIAPMIRAISLGRADVCRFLLERGALVNASSNAENSYLSMACRRGDANLCRLLLTHGAAPSGGNLWEAACAGYPEVCRLIVEAGIDINKPYRDRTMTALHGAALMNHVETVLMLLEAGADPRLRHDGGQSMIEMAKEKGNEAVLGVTLAWLARLAALQAAQEVQMGSCPGSCVGLK